MRRRVEQAKAKELKSRIAAATTELNHHLEFLDGVDKRARAFMKDPFSGSPVSIGTQLVHDLRFEHKETLAIVANLLDCIYSDTRALCELEEQIKAF